MKRIFSFLILLISAIPAFNQANSDLVNQYLKVYPKDNILIRDASDEIVFEYDKKNQTIVTNEVTKYQLIALKPYASAKISAFYDDHTEIVSSSASSADKICGNYNPEGVFHSDLKVCIFTLDFKNSGQEKTVIIKRRHSDIHYFPKVYFAGQKYPVIKSSVTFTIPKGFDVDINNYNTENYSFQKHQSTGKDQAVKLEFSCENIPIYHDETDLPPSAYYDPQLLIIPRSFASDNVKQNFLATLPDLYAWCKHNTDQTKNDVQKLTPVVAQITEGKKTDLDKIKAIYYWVQDNIRYIAFEEGLAGYIPENAQKVYDDKYGDCKGMANLLKTMLHIAGFDARLTWMGTKDVRFDYTIPTLASSNHMVCALFFNQQRYILDATNKYNSFGYCSEAIAGRPVLVEDGNNFILDTIPSSYYKENKVSNKMDLVLDDTNLTGTVSLSFDGSFRSSALAKLHYIRTDEQPKMLESIVDRRLAKITATHVSSSNIGNRDTTLVVKATLTVKGLVNQFENDLYVTLDPFDDINQIDVANDRKLPLFIESREIRKTTSKFKLPNGYKLKKLPENYTLSTGYLTYKTSYKVEGSYISYAKEIMIHANFIPQSDIGKWISDLKQIKKAIKQPVILTKL